MTPAKPKAALPRMVAVPLRRDLATWSLNAIALGALEGGLMGVIVKSVFDGAAESAWVNTAVAIVAGAPAFANLVSLRAARWSHGRQKVRLLRQLMLVLSACLLLLALPPVSPVGLVMFCTLAVVGRMAWSGILTLRAVLWRANYARQVRGSVAGRIAQLASLIMAATSAAIGLALDWNSEAFRVLYPAAGIAALVAYRMYARTRHRRESQYLAAEQSALDTDDSLPGWSSMVRVLRGDRNFRDYMAGMMVFGSGNLMVTAMLVVILAEQFGMPRFQQVLITSSLPLVVLCFTTRIWGRLLDQRHIFEYRAVHSWAFVTAFVVFCLAALTGNGSWFWPGAAILGFAYGGAYVGWNLGHNDFATDAQSSLYMAIHVTLTGLRGGIMPLVGVGFYQLLREAGLARYALLLPMMLSLLGALWFVHLARRHRTLRLDAGSDSTG